MHNPKDSKILLVDDSEVYIQMLLELLKDYDILAATSGPDALEILEHEPVDLVLLDIMMPGMDGFKVCQRIRCNPKTEHLPVIFTTARDDEASIEKAYEAGAYDYVTKPFRPRELLARVDSQLTLHHQYMLLDQQTRELELKTTELENTYKNYFTALDTSLDGFWVVNEEAIILDTNQAYCDLSGYSRDEIINHSITVFDCQLSQQDIIALLSQLPPGKTKKFSSIHKKENGEQWHVEISATASSVQENQYFGFIKDITSEYRTEQFNQLRQFLSEKVSVGSLEELAQTAIDKIEHLTKSQIAFFHFIEDNQETVRLQFWSSNTLSIHCSVDASQQHYPLSQAGVWTDCVEQKKTVIYNDFPAVSGQKGTPDGHPPLQKIMTTPVFREGMIVAVLGLGNKTTDYNQDDINLATMTADMTYDFIQRHQAEQHVKHMAYYDSLTNLPNRELFMDRIHQAIYLAERTRTLIGVCYLDLDGFKPVNDKYGHHAGDQLLIKFSHRMKETMREGDTIARMGGDEFVILLNNLKTTNDAEEIIQRLLKIISQPFEIEDHIVKISASIGIALFPEDSLEAEILLRKSDQGMYRAKSSGKNNYCFYSRNIDVVN